MTCVAHFGQTPPPPPLWSNSGSSGGVPPPEPSSDAPAAGDRTPSDHVASSSEIVRSLAIAGQTGTLADRMQGTAAAGRCQGKTGTLHDVSNLAGYCRAADGHTLAFAATLISLGGASRPPGASIPGSGRRTWPW